MENFDNIIEKPENLNLDVLYPHNNEDWKKIQGIILKDIEGYVQKFLKENVIINGNPVSLTYETKERSVKNNNFQNMLRDKNDRLILPAVVMYVPSQEFLTKMWVPNFVNTRKIVHYEISKEQQYNTKPTKVLYDVYDIPWPQFFNLTYNIEFYTTWITDVNQFKAFAGKNMRFWLNCFGGRYEFYSTIVINNRPIFTQDINGRLITQPITLTVNYAFEVDVENLMTTMALRKYVLSKPQLNRLGMKV